MRVKCTTYDHTNRRQLGNGRLLQYIVFRDTSWFLHLAHAVDTIFDGSCILLLGLVLRCEPFCRVGDVFDALQSWLNLVFVIVVGDIEPPVIGIERLLSLDEGPELLT